MKTMKDLLIRMNIHDFSPDEWDEVRCGSVGYTQFALKQVEHYRKQLQQVAREYIKDLDQHIAKTKDKNWAMMSDGEVAKLIMEKTKKWIKYFFNLGDEE